METKKSTTSPGTRLEMGAAILAAARMVDTELIKPRLTAFISAHRSYVAAQRKVDAADDQMREAQAQLTQRDAEQDEAVERLAGALANEGLPRTNPFAAFGAAAPSLIKKLPYPDEAKAIHQLAAAVQRSKTISQATRDTARAEEKAAQVIEAALFPIDKLEVVIRDARHERDTVGQTWDTALAALRRGARAAADDGAPGLYTALFGRLLRSSSRKNAKPVPPPPPAPVPSPSVT